MTPRQPSYLDLVAESGCSLPWRLACGQWPRPQPPRLMPTARPIAPPFRPILACRSGGGCFSIGRARYRGRMSAGTEPREQPSARKAFRQVGRVTRCRVTPKASSWRAPLRRASPRCRSRRPVSAPKRRPASTRRALPRSARPKAPHVFFARSGRRGPRGEGPLDSVSPEHVPVEEARQCASYWQI